MVPVQQGRAPIRNLTALAAAAALVALANPAVAQNFPITPAQRATAAQVAQQGVAISELAPNAPDSYTVKRGDTLWAISGMFLKSPWKWPELWGMNMAEVRNPHLIYPGQQLYLEKNDGRAVLRMGRAPANSEPSDVTRVSPRVRVEPLAGDGAVPTLKAHLIEPFLSEAMIVDERTLVSAPRIVAAPPERFLITRGDRAYARGLAATPLMQRTPGRADNYRVFRDATPLRDPVTNTILGYEAKYVGRASLVRSEGSEMVRTSGGASESMVVPGTIDITSAKEEMRVGDRLLPEPPREFQTYVPHAPSSPLVNAAIVSVYGDAVSYAGQNQVVVINKGTADGIETGHVMAILKNGGIMVERSRDGERKQLKLPYGRNGLLMVFRPYERLSYALILEITDTVKVGDRLVNPR
ncbi:MAG: LysM peptidoglycan-binding domain-containing protein [Ramlibacter sp.]|nr:LysM peptidoglycan-binding domain-containing protein [Ramlibacter sp.]